MDIDFLEDIDKAWYDTSTIVSVLIDRYHLSPSIGLNYGGNAVQLG
uniref:Uncharacterized protein n=1 Tax=Arundo donax TaxID=35708 RepID=A0A0A8YD99_ARUDO